MLLICAAKGSYGHPKCILLGDTQVADAHTPQMGDLSNHTASPKQELKCTMCKHWLLHTNLLNADSLLFIPFAAIHVAACTSWGFLTVSECPKQQKQKQHLVPFTNCFFQD